MQFLGLLVVLSDLSSTEAEVALLWGEGSDFVRLFLKANLMQSRGAPFLALKAVSPIKLDTGASKCYSGQILHL